MNLVNIKRKVRIISSKLGLYKILRDLAHVLRGSNKSVMEKRSFYGRFVGSGDLVFDVGANRGQSSEHFIKLGAKVVAFEPQESLHDQIRQLCSKSNNLTIEPYALSSEEGETVLHLTEYDQAASIRDDWEGVRCGTKTIKVSTLDKMMEKYGAPRYCKIDVEGWELQVLEGLSKSVPLISFEYHARSKEMELAAQVLSKIGSLGDYFCNVCIDGDFRYEKAMPLSDLANLFEKEAIFNDGKTYGDIFCSTDADIISRVK